MIGSKVPSSLVTAANLLTYFFEFCSTICPTFLARVLLFCGLSPNLVHSNENLLSATNNTENNLIYTAILFF